MKSFDFSFSSPWMLLLILPLLALTVLPFVRLPKRRKTKKLLISLVCRCLAVALLATTLSGATYVSKSDDVSVMVLADLSDSTLPMRASMENFVQELLQNADKDTEIGLMAFADNCVYELQLGDSSEFTDFDSLSAEPVGGATDIEDALRTAYSYLNTDTCGRIILLSDGKETEGNAAAAAVEIAYQQIRVDTVLFDTENSGGSEVQINDVDMPESAYTGNAFDITVTLDSTAATSGTLSVYDNGDLAAEMDVSVSEGVNTFTLQDTASYSGVHTFQTTLSADDDSIDQNNSYYSYIQVSGLPNILLIDGTGSESAKLLNVLQDTYKITKVSALSAPDSLAELQNYDEIILMNASTDDLPSGYDALLDDYIQVLGRSVFTTGGTNTYYYGNMANTAFSDFLPVNVDLSDEEDSGSTALMILIDSSSSMTGTPFSLAKQGAINSVNMLDDQDYVGIISFSGNTKVVSDLISAKNKDSVISAINALSNSRGTYLTDAIEEAYDQLKESDADTRHVIIISDGNPQDSGYNSVVKNMYADGITTSTIMIGDESSTLMKSLAEIGGGNFYDVDNVSDLPDVMEDETESVLTSYINEGIFTPTVGTISGVLSGVDSLPELDGYITTSLKSGATNVLYTDDSRPIYAEWDYGLGKVASFTSDLSGDWSSAFLSEEDGIRFIENVISSLIPDENTTTGLTVDVTQDGSQVTLEAQTADSSGDSSVTAVVVPPEGDSYSVTLNAVSPGTYTGTMETSGEGVYTLLVQQSDASGSLIAYRQTAVAASYSAEYDAFLEGGDTLLENISTLSGGELMTSAADLFRVKLEPTETEKSLYLPLVIMAALLLLTDLVLRNIKWKDIKMLFLRLRKS